MVNRTGLMSMTGFASRSGETEGWDWSWELRSVNNKGLDLRLRFPDGYDALEATARGQLQTELARGSIALTFKTGLRGGISALQIEPGALKAALAALATVEAEAVAAGIALTPPCASDILSVRGVVEIGTGAPPVAAISADAAAALPGLIDDLAAMRATEGARLASVLTAQLDRIESLTADAAREAEARREDTKRAMQDALARVIDNTDKIDAARIEQELALIAIKSDVTEEIDRLGAHVGAARELLASKQPIGRKLDFLMQEFLREANTLCSKSGAAPLTRIGLDLKVVIDQLREQVQNVE